MINKDGAEQDSIIKEIVVSFLRLSIAKKMLLGYLPLAALIILISVFALSNLNRLNNINNSIINRDAPLIESADKLIENIIAQELYGRRYAILKSHDMLALFWKRSEEIDQIIKQIRTFHDIKGFPIDKLALLHTEYNDLFIKGVRYLEKPSSTLAKNHEKQIKAKQEELIKLVKSISSEARSEQNKKIFMIAHIGDTAFWVTALVCSLGILFGIGAAILITRNISGAIHQLELATQKVSEGKFDFTHNIRNQDELGDLSHAFDEMTKRLKRLEEMNLDMNPLTRLPGGLAIENVLKKRLDAKNPIAFCLIDMDNFKPFNDRYGYAKGSDAIQATARLIEAAVAESGTEEDFIGHIGGDDFVVITTPDKYIKICNAVIEAFDKMIPDFYDPEDRRRGHIIGKTRQGQEMTFPIMTISIAVVTNLHRELTHPAQVGAIAADLKEYAKTLPGSIYVVDKRRENPQQPGYAENIIAFPKETDLDKKVKDA